MKKMIAALMVFGTLTLSANAFANEQPYEQEDDGGHGSPSGNVLTTDDPSDADRKRTSEPAAEEGFISRVLALLGGIAQIVDAEPAFRYTVD